MNCKGFSHHSNKACYHEMLKVLGINSFILNYRLAETKIQMQLHQKTVPH